MKLIVIIVCILTLCLFLCIFFIKNRQENFGEDLRDPMHLSATVYRASNTILTAANVFSDKMDSLPLPESVKDSFNEWIEKGFISPIKDQMLCGGCWAFATCASLADRLTIATNGQWQPEFGLSEQTLISCGGTMGMDFYQGCEGGIPHFAIDALTKQGVPADEPCPTCSVTPVSPGGSGGASRGGGVVNPNNTNTCSSGGNVYASTNYTWWQTGCDGNTSCSLTAASTCPCGLITDKMKTGVRYKTVGEAHNYTSHGENNELHTVDLWPDIPQSVIDKNVERMKKAIYYEGPITVGYRVTQDFYTYWPTANDSNYYKYDGRSPMAGGHAVVIVGWKKMSDGTPVWIIKNSWGANGGYGFPNSPKKYLGGFWNHIMGINDSFIESNAAGAHPDLTVPEISKYLPNGGKDIPEKWMDTMTLRDIYNMTAKNTPLPTPQPQPQPGPTPTPQPQPPPHIKPIVKPVIIDSKLFKTITLSPDNITPQSIQLFFKDPSNLFIIGSNSAQELQKMVKYIPRKNKLSDADMVKLADDFMKNITGYLVFAGRGQMNVYYYLAGDPAEWKHMFNKTYLNRAATERKFINKVFASLSSLNTLAPILQLS